MDIREEDLRQYIDFTGSLDLPNKGRYEGYVGRFVDYDGAVCFKPTLRRILVDGNMAEKNNINNSLIFLSEGDKLHVGGSSFIFREEEESQS